MRALKTSFMKTHSFLLLACLLAAVNPLRAQEKVSRKTMIFQPGARVPDGLAPAKEPGASSKPAETGDPKIPTASKSGSKPGTPEGNPPPVGASIEDTEIPRQMAARFFGLLLKGQVEAAYEGLTKGSKIAERAEESKALRLKTQEALKVFGAVVGFEQVEVKSVGPHLLRLTYLTVGKEFPLRWRLYFYRPDTFWRLVDIRVDDRLSGLFGEAEETRGGEAKP